MQDKTICEQPEDFVGPHGHIIRQTTETSKLVCFTDGCAIYMEAGESELISEETGWETISPCIWIKQ